MGCKAEGQRNRLEVMRPLRAAHPRCRRLLPNLRTEVGQAPGLSSPHVEQTQSGELRFLQQIALQVLLFQHGKLVGGILAGVGAELAFNPRPNRGKMTADQLYMLEKQY